MIYCLECIKWKSDFPFLASMHVDQKLIAVLSIDVVLTNEI